MARFFLIFIALCFLAFGGFGLIDPLTLTNSFGLGATGPHAVFELRGIYGGVSLGAALLALLGALRPSLQRPALIFTFTYTGGYVFARFVGLLLSDQPEPYYYSFIAFEVFCASVSGLLLLRQPSTT